MAAPLDVIDEQAGPSDRRFAVRPLDVIDEQAGPSDRRFAVRPLDVVDEQAGPSNRRFVLRLADGARVEAVAYCGGETACVSCQVGCAVGCPFCASGRNGLGRPLTLAEMVGQIEALRTLGLRPHRVTVSGIGEPLHNAGVVSAFLSWCRRERIAPSLTTSGGTLARLTEALLDWPHNGLTLSVHAGSEAVRARLVPRGPPLAALFSLLAALTPKLSARRRKKTALAYLLLDGENDGDEEVRAFVERSRPLGLLVHLYAYNPVPGGPPSGVSEKRFQEVYDAMQAGGLEVRRSSKARREPVGGCGTLVSLRRGPRAASTPDRRPSEDTDVSP
ncbi:MAG: radical SAM protein [Polyangiaceae bacterium]|nr:radical SAM protein [Polyangiaceae bacterium]